MYHALTHRSMEALAPNITNPSTIIVLTMQDKEVLFFHKKDFQLRYIFPCQEMIESANILCYMFPEMFQHIKLCPHIPLHRNQAWLTANCTWHVPWMCFHFLIEAFHNWKF